MQVVAMRQFGGLRASPGLDVRLDWPLVQLSLLVCVLVLGGCSGTQVEYPLKGATPTEFLIGPEDVLIVNVWRNQELSKEVIVRPDGKISLPLIGDVQAARNDRTGPIKTHCRRASRIHC